MSQELQDSFAQQLRLLQQENAALHQQLARAPAPAPAPEAPPPSAAHATAGEGGGGFAGGRGGGLGHGPPRGGVGAASGGSGVPSQAAEPERVEQLVGRPELVALRQESAIYIYIRVAARCNGAYWGVMGCNGV